MPNHRDTTVLQLFKHLQGVWKLKRRLGTQGYMQGVARFQTRREGMLYYQEQGSATFGNGKTFSAYRAYAYVYGQGTIAVHSWNSVHEQPAELLYTLYFQSANTTSQALVATGTHECVNDVYQAQYTFVSHKHFQLTYRVKGPHKDYVIQTHFSRGIDRPPCL
jgi:Family of unknown function (DUF6314)